MNRRPLWPLLLPVFAVAFIAGFLGVSTWGKLGAHCMLLKITGLYCPGCGGTRCAFDLAAGNWQQALGHNALLTVGAMAFSILCIYLITRVTILGKPAPGLPSIPAHWLWTGLLLILLFTVLRNIPAWPFTMLAP